MKNSIYYYGFNKLLSLTMCSKEAILLDKIIFYYQGTLLKRDNRLWFTKKIPDLAVELGFSESRIYIYLKNLELKGLILRKRYKYYGVPRSFISLTNSLQDQLAIQSNPSIQNIDIKEKVPLPDNISDRMDSLVPGESINKDQNNVINNINFEKHHLKIKFKELNIVKGMLSNVQNQHGVKLSSPNQVLDEILFSLSNKEQFPNIKTFQHKINIISQLLRNNRWKTPKGFGKYCPEAHLYKKKYADDNRCRLQNKIEELAYSGLNELDSSKRLLNVFDLSHTPNSNVEMLKSFRVQQSVVNGIKKDMKFITNAKIFANFTQMLFQEELKLSKLKTELEI